MRGIAKDLGIQVEEIDGNGIELISPPGKAFNGDQHTLVYIPEDEGLNPAVARVMAYEAAWKDMVDGLNLGKCEIEDCDTCMEDKS